MMNATIDTRQAEARNAMIASQLRTSAVTDTRVIAAMAEVAREDFLPTSQRALAYRDRPVPLEGGREQNAPLATARLLTAAQIGADHKVLLIGAAGGYTAALLGHMTRSVVAVESDPALLAMARRALPEGTASLVEASLSEGYPGGAPYDVIVIDGAIEQLPDALVEQVRIGGSIVTGVIERGVSRLAAGTRTAGGFALVPFADIDCVPLPGFARPRHFQFPG